MDLQNCPHELQCRVARRPPERAAASSRGGARAPRLLPALVSEEHFRSFAGIRSTLRLTARSSHASVTKTKPPPPAPRAPSHPNLDAGRPAACSSTSFLRRCFAHHDDARNQKERGSNSAAMGGKARRQQRTEAARDPRPCRMVMVGAIYFPFGFWGLGRVLLESPSWPHDFVANEVSLALPLKYKVTSTVIGLRCICITNGPKIATMTCSRPIAPPWP